MKSNRKGINIIKQLKDNIKLQVLFCVVSSAVIILVFLLLYNIFSNKVFHKYTITEDVSFVNTIEDVSIEDDSITLKGYAFVLDRESKDSTISLFLRNAENGKEVWFDVNQSARADVNSYFNGDSSYEYSGFLASTKAGNLHTDECYEIILNIDYTNNDGNIVRKTVSSNKFIVGGKIYDYNPKAFDAPDMNIESDLLREVFTKGKLCFYKKEEGLYVYQYDNKLYYIATNDFVFNESGTTIYCHLYTSQVNKLPSESIPNKFEFRDFMFEQYEYREENTAPYRVAIRDISTDYVITNINTGVYDTVNGAWNNLTPFQIGYPISGQ